MHSTIIRDNDKGLSRRNGFYIGGSCQLKPESQHGGDHPVDPQSGITTRYQNCSTVFIDYNRLSGGLTDKERPRLTSSQHPGFVNSQREQLTTATRRCAA